MSEKIKAAVARMRAHIDDLSAHPAALDIGQAVKLEDMRIITDAAEAALPPEPRDHVIIVRTQEGAITIFNRAGLTVTTKAEADEAVRIWGKVFPFASYSVAKAPPERVAGFTGTAHGMPR